MDRKNEVWHSPIEVATITSVKVRTVYGWLRKGLLPYTKLGNGRGSRVRIKSTDLTEFMDSGRRIAITKEARNG